MQRFIEFLTESYSRTIDPWRRADPFLMGAAIAYNSLFALVPLAIAFLSIVSLFEGSRELLVGLVELINTSFPPEISAFLVDLLEQSGQFVSDDSVVILVVSIGVALWSGSRAVYAAQKALRLVEGGDDDRGYVQTRLTGIVVTIGAGASVLVTYGLMLLGEDAWNEISNFIGVPQRGYAQLLVGAVAILWVYGLLWVVYRFGPPQPVRHAVVVAGVVTFVLVAGTWIAFNLLPGDANESLAVFGALGIILIWLYFVGITVVAAPILNLALWDAWTELSDRYPSSNDGEQGTTEGSEDRTSTSP
ncbi:MAG: YihY/virulence factor BrkB family protein [Acidimicrobiia bacterium]